MRTNLLRASLTGLLVLTMTTGAQAASLSRSAAFEYNAAHGLLLKESIEPDTPQLRVDTTYTYDAFGNKVTATVSSPATGSAAISARTTGNTYDSRGQFVTGSSNALGQTETKTYDPKTGQITSLKGPNGLTTSWTYDGFDRKTRETRADGTQTRWDYLYCSGFNDGTTSCPARAFYVVQTTPLAGDGVTVNGAWTKTYVDTLGREVRTEIPGFDGTSIIAKDTEYDSLGRIARTSAPYYAGQPIQWTVPSYDALGRVIRTTAPDGSQTQVAYNGLNTTTSNALNQTRTELRNSQGQLVRVTDAAGKALNYQYDPLGNLVKTIDPQGNVVTLTYDLRGRKTGMSDPDMGTWSYEYNVLGELTKQTDAKGQVSTLAYDALGRMTRRTEPDLVSTWTYDNCIMGVGKPCGATSDNGYSRSHSYDSLGRARSNTTTIDASYTNSITFDANGRLATHTYPAGVVVKYVYTSLGYLKEVRNNATNALYWKADSMDAEGHLLQQTYGNGIVTTQQFDAATGRLKKITAGTNNAVQNLSYTYDSVGNVSSRSDATQGLSEVFLYDSLNRLTSASVSSPGAGSVTTAYTYDSIGNLTSRSGLGSYVYGATNMRPHGLTQINLTNGGRRVYTYDANGALTREAEYDIAGQPIASKERTEVYTSFGMPQAMGKPGISLAFAYGPEHQRVKQIAPSATTIYLHPDNAGGLLYEKDIKPDGSIEHKSYITAGGQVIALHKRVGSATTVSYFHRDHLGSTSAVSNEAGTVAERLAYEPFGKRRFADGKLDLNGTIVGINTDRGFTNHEHLDEIGLIHMNGRVFDPEVGRFMSADPFIPAPGNLQSYNRYSYLRNSPTGGIDPSGFFDEDPIIIGPKPSPKPMPICIGFVCFSPLPKPSPLPRDDSPPAGSGGSSAPAPAPVSTPAPAPSPTTWVPTPTVTLNANLIGANSAPKGEPGWFSSFLENSGIGPHLESSWSALQSESLADFVFNRMLPALPASGSALTAFPRLGQMRFVSPISHLFGKPTAADEALQVATKGSASLGEVIFTTTNARSGVIAENVVKSGQTLTFENLTIASAAGGRDLIGPVKQLLTFARENGATTLQFRGTFSSPNLAARFGVKAGDTFDFTMKADRSAVLDFLTRF